MKSITTSAFLLLACLMIAGCGDSEPRSVLDGVDPSELQKYEEELAKVTGQDLEANLKDEAATE